MKREHSSDSEDNKPTADKKRLMPKRADYRMRAHINPLNTTPFAYPLNPSHVNWRAHYPSILGGEEKERLAISCNTVEHPSQYDTVQPDFPQPVEIIDIGCGFGGLLFTLGKEFPKKLIFGLEIRDKLVNYVAEKVHAMRVEHPGEYQNIGVTRTNSMRHLCQYFRKATLQKIFVCFPDPHFKAKNFRRRIVNTGFLSEYAFLLKPKGRFYCITDVKQLHDWHYKHLLQHKMFREMTEEELKEDPCIELMRTSSEESKKVERNKGSKFWSVFEKVE